MVIMMLVLAVAAYCLVRRMLKMRAAMPAQPDQRAGILNAANAAPMPNIDRWTALDDHQLARLLDESAP